MGAEELDICYYKAKAQYLSGDVDGAIDTYTAIIDYNKDSDAYYLRGCIYFAKNDTDKGLKDLRRRSVRMMIIMSSILAFMRPCQSMA